MCCLLSSHVRKVVVYKFLKKNLIGITVGLRKIGITVGLRGKQNFCPPSFVVVTALLSGVVVLAQCVPPERLT